jgi:hypothetical protein
LHAIAQLVRHRRELDLQLLDARGEAAEERTPGVLDHALAVELAAAAVDLRLPVVRAEREQLQPHDVAGLVDELLRRP